MTKVKIEPGICGLPTAVEAECDEDMEITVKVRSGCKSIKDMFSDLGDTFDAYEVCLRKPGEGPFYEYAQEHFPVHVSCPAINGIIKCMEVAANLALPKDAHILFVNEE